MPLLQTRNGQGRFREKVLGSVLIGCALLFAGNSWWLLQWKRIACWGLLNFTGLLIVLANVLLMCPKRLK